MVIALLLGATDEGDLRPLALGVVLGVAASSLFALPRRGIRVAGDALLAMVVIGASAITLVIARYLKQDYQHVQGALFGDAVVASSSELVLLGAVAALRSLSTTCSVTDSCWSPSTRTRGARRACGPGAGASCSG